MEQWVQRFRAGAVAVDVLAENLRGLAEAADFKSDHLRDDFLDLWSRIDMEAELRTEPWAPPGSGNDEVLRDGLDALTSWVNARLADDNHERA
jgi:hypothetical protein